MIKLKIKKLEEIIEDKKFIEKVADLIFSGGVIADKKNIIANLKRIHKLFLLYEINNTDEEKLIGTSAIKNPNKDYAQRIFEKFNLKYNNEKEIGYVFIAERYRNNGLGKLIVANTLMHAVSEKLDIFLTCNSENKPIIKINDLYRLPLIGSFNSENNKIINFYLIKQKNN